MTTPTSVESIVSDAGWLAHRYDPGHDAVHFLKVDRATHRTATFVTDEYLPKDLPKIVLRRDESVAAARPVSGPIHFIFHSAFCGSTLLARALDIPGVSMGLKEPMMFNDIVGWRRRGGDTRDVARMLDDALMLQARRFAPGEVTVLKASNVANAFAPAMLAMRPDARAILLYAPLKVFLGSIARKQLFGRLWVRDLLAGQIADGIVDLGFTNDQFFGQTDLQVAAAGWLVQKALFARLSDRFGDRVRTLDSEDFIASPADTMIGIRKLFQLDATEAQVLDVARGPAFTRHSKTGESFDASHRVSAQVSSAELYREEIDQVAIWAEAVAKAMNIAMRPGVPLFG